MNYQLTRCPAHRARERRPDEGTGSRLGNSHKSLLPSESIGLLCIRRPQPWNQHCSAIQRDRPAQLAVLPRRS